MPRFLSASKMIKGMEKTTRGTLLIARHAKVCSQALDAGIADVDAIDEGVETD